MRSNRRESNRSNRSQDRDSQGRFTGDRRRQHQNMNYNQGNYGRGGYGSYDDNMGYGSGSYERESHSGLGYGNDPQSFENSYGRGHGYPGRENLGSNFDRHYEGYQPPRNQVGNRESRHENSGWAFGRSWNREENDSNSLNSGNGNRYGLHRGTRIGNSGSLDRMFPNNHGKGPKGYQRSDERIREDINDQLSDDYEIDASEIEVKVSNGEVTLSGSVGERNVKRLAEDIAESVSGVKNVENRIRINESTKEEDTRQGNSTTKSNDRSKMRESFA
jgi:hypothetical protein